MVDEIGIVRVTNRVEIFGPQARLRQAPRGGLVGLFPSRKRHRSFAVLASAEPLLLGSGHDIAVDDYGRRGIVKYGVDAEHPHVVALPPAIDRTTATYPTATSLNTYT